MHRGIGPRTLLQAQHLHTYDLPVRLLRGAGDSRACSRRHASKNEQQKALTDVPLAEGPPGILGFGFGDEELANLQRHFEPVELRVVPGTAACRKGATVSDAAALLAPQSGQPSPGEGEPFACFSRVVMFCGLPGEVIEGLIEVWPMELCESELISFAYFAASMAESDLEATLLKVIKASDANETSEDGMEETSKEQLRKMLDSMKQGGGRRQVFRGKGESKQSNDSKGKGFGR